MTVKEISEKYNVSENSVQTKFKRTQESIEKKYGIRIIKEGRGKNATYLEEIVEKEDGRANTMYEEKNDVMIPVNNLSMISWDLAVFLGIASTPGLMFRGTYTQFLQYIGLKKSFENLEMLQGTFKNLASKNYILYMEDHTVINSDSFIAAISRKSEDELKIGINMINICKDIAQKNNRHSWIPILKVWVAIEFLADYQPFTVSELEALTGLSAYTIRQSKKDLEANEVFMTSRAYVAYDKCVGQNVTLCAFCDNYGML